MEPVAADPAPPVGARFAGPEPPQKTLFISRAGADADLAAEIGGILTSAGYDVILQQWDFANRHFMERMHDALASGAHVVALLSPAYLRSDHCQAEWMNAIAGDPLNRDGRLILLRVAECTPPGLLAGLAYWDLVPAKGDPARFAEIVSGAVRSERRTPRAGASAGRSAPVTVAPPRGTVTFVFTDDDAAAQRDERATTRAALGRGGPAVLDAVARHGGFVFAAVDANVRAAFSDAASAIAAARAAQAAAFAQGARLRIAVHSGAAEERGGDYAGPTVDRSARLLAAGAGGHVLASSVSVELARGNADLGDLRDLGKLALTDSDDVEHVFALDVPGAPADLPALRCTAPVRHNLPQEVKSLIGRERDVAAIQTLLRQARIVTLIGVGGVGKTSCSLCAAAGSLDGYPDGVWFVDLSAIGDPALVAAEVAAVFHVVESGKRPVLDALVEVLRGLHALIVLDNCEHVIEACSRLAGAMLRACPKISLLANSREALKVSGEYVYHLSTLAVPEPGADVPVDAALGFGAIALFVARARAADARFELTPQNVGSVIEICRRLDGIPLALELAAARARVLAPRQLEQKLDERFRLLTTGARSALPRQQTMRALIDWSYDLLDERERTLFCALSIFSGSFSLDAAIAVCAGGAIEEFDVIDGLTSLVEKSLVVAESVDTDTRYRLFESIREYGRGRLEEYGTRAELSRRHAVAFTAIAKRLDDEYGTSRYRAWVADAEREIENVRAALVWTFGPDGDLAVGLTLAALLRRIFNTLFPAEARRWIQTALERVNASTPPDVVAQLELADAVIASRFNQFKPALAAAHRALAIFTATGDGRGVARAKRLAGRSLIFLGDVEAGEALLRAALETYAELGFEKNGALLLDLGSARAANRDLDGARDFFGRALEQFIADDDAANVAIAAGTLAEAEFRGGDAAAAIRHAQEALAAAHDLPRHITMWLQSNLAAFLIAQDEFARARPCIERALRTAQQLQSEFWIAVLVQHAAAVLVLEPCGERRSIKSDDLAARLTGFVDAKLHELGVTREFTEQQEYDRVRSVLTGARSAPPMTFSAEGAALKTERVAELVTAAIAQRSDNIEPVLAAPV